MYFRLSIGLLILCLNMGCSIFKNDKTQVTDLPVDRTNIPELPTEYETPVLVHIDTFVPPPPPKAPLEYMTIEEQAMVDEINLLRADPISYIRFVDDYIQDIMNDPSWDFNARQAERIAADELVRTLRHMPPLDLLEPSEDLYKVALKHGLDMKENKFIGHLGSDNSMPEQRIQDSTTMVGSENLAAGGRSVRESVLMLLVDANDKISRSHRKTILNPAWKYVACYYAGTVDEIPGTWVQLFGFEDVNDPSINKPIRNRPEKIEVGVPATGDFSFMSTFEKDMIDEINLMRSNPKAYIEYLEEYVEEEKKIMIGLDEEYDKAVDELKNQLQTMGTLSVLKPHQKMFEVAKAHGIDNQTNNRIDHKGSDGRTSFQRVKDSGLKNSITWENGSGNYAPNENLAAGTENMTVRETVMMLLIDYGIPNRGHRKALVEPSWEYVACYHIGLIENLKDYVDAGMEDTNAPNCWVQLFAKGPDDNASVSVQNTDDSKPEMESKDDDEISPPPSTSNPVTTSTEVNEEKEKEVSEVEEEAKTNSTDQKNEAASGDFSFMSTLEKSMIDEINLMRSDPAGYVKYLESYVEEEKKMMIGVDADYDVAVNELKSKLNSIGKLSTLKPHKKLYEVAKAHGIDNQKHNQIEHTGSDGRSSFQRVKDSGLNNSITWVNGSGNYAPNENLATGTQDITVRETVMMLLIDYGIPTRGHRKALIEPSWEYVACYHIDMIKNLKDYVDAGMEDTDAPNCWVQLFAKD